MINYTKRMLKSFLQNQRYALLVAKVAIIFQSFVTLLIGVFLILSLYHIEYPVSMLLMVLYTDIVFVCIHLIYRIFYSGMKIQLQKSEQKILVLHIATSLVALSMTYYISQGLLVVSTSIILMTLIFWVISLSTGVVFYTKKYNQ